MSTAIQDGGFLTLLEDGRSQGLVEERDAQQTAGVAALIRLATETPPRVDGPGWTLPAAPAQRPAGIPAAPETSREQPWRHELRGVAARLSHGPWPLVGVLLLQSGLSLPLVWSDTAFNDEALYLWSGHWEIAHLLYGTTIPRFQAYFSGAPVIYPVIGAIADAYGGLTAARLLSLAFMLGATLLLYAAARRLYTPRAGLIGAAMFAVLGPVQFLGAFATYDPMALFLLAASACLVIHARRWWSEPALILAAVTLSLADATKYATGLWNPVVIALAGLTATSGLWWRDVLRAARLALYVAGLLLTALHFAGPAYVRGLMFTTLARHLSTTPVMHILAESAAWIGLLLVFAARALFISQPARSRLLAATLVVAGLLAPLAQARIHQGTSLQKHVAFGAWFAAIAAGFVFDYALKRSKYAHWRLPAAALAAVGSLGVLQAPALHGAWPDSQRVVAAIARARSRSPGEVLSEQGVVTAYYLHLSPSELTDTFGFEHWNPSRTRMLHGQLAYEDAIRTHYFPVIEIDGQFSYRARSPDRIIAATVSKTPGYKLVFAAPWSSSLGHGVFRVWRYVGGTR
jgi:4-amino-4-deoxy-L-arabinose transferase-like glycosyltransferase